jgi:hypothetical protein
MTVARPFIRSEMPVDDSGRQQMRLDLAEAVRFLIGPTDQCHRSMKQTQVVRIPMVRPSTDPVLPEATNGASPWGHPWFGSHKPAEL